MSRRKTSYAGFLVGIVFFLALIFGIQALARRQAASPIPAPAARNRATPQATNGPSAADAYPTAPADEPAPVVAASPAPAVEAAPEPAEPAPVIAGQPAPETPAPPRVGGATIVGQVTRDDGSPAVGALVFAVQFQGPPGGGGPGGGPGWGGQGGGRRQRQGGDQGGGAPRKQDGGGRPGGGGGRRQGAGGGPGGGGNPWGGGGPGGGPEGGPGGPGGRLGRFVEQFTPGGEGTVAQGVADGSGTYRLEFVPEGMVFVIAQLEGFSRSAGRVDVPAQGEVRCDLTLQPVGFILGRVTDLAGGPVAGATVQAMGGGGPGGGGGRGGRGGRGGAGAETTSAEDGTFVLDGLRDGQEYVLAASADGFGPAYLMGVTASTDGVDLQLTAGCRLAGVIVDGLNGQPIAEPRLRVRSENPVLSRLARPETQEDGSFEVANLAPGTYELAVSAGGYGDATAGPFTLEGGDATTGIRIEMLAGASVSGRVLDAANGRPIAGAIVYAVVSGGGGGPGGGPGRGGGGRMPMQVEVPEMLRRTLDEEVFSETDEDGRFHIALVPSGHVPIRAVHESYRTSEVAVDVSPGVDADGVEIVLAGGSRIVGTVIGEDGRPAAEMRISVMGNGTVRMAVTGDDGRYEVGGLDVGLYTVNPIVERSPGPGMMLATPATGTDVQLAEGETRTVDFRLEPPVTVVGFVSRDGQPAAGVEVRLSGMGGPGGYRGETDESGRYEIEGVPPGSYPIMAGSSRLSQIAEVPHGVSTATVDIALPSGRIEGIVTDVETGLPIADADVRVLVGEAAPGDALQGFVARARTDEDGTYLATGLDAGTYRVTASGRGYAQAERTGITVNLGGSVQGVDFQLGGGLSITGTVFGASGDPKAGAVFWVERIDTGTPTVRRPDGGSEADGRYRLRNLAPGTYRVTAGASGETCRSEVVEIAETDVVCDFALPRGATLQVTVTTAQGVPAEGAYVTPVQTEGQRLRVPFLSFGDDGTGPTDPTGRFVRGYLPPGPYRITVTRNGSAPAVVDVNLGPGQTVEVPVMLAPGQAF